MFSTRMPDTDQIFHSFECTHLCSNFLNLMGVHWLCWLGACETEWKFLTGLSREISRGDIETATQFCGLTSQLISRLQKFLRDNVEEYSKMSHGRFVLWLRYHNRVLESVRLRARKLLMFVRFVSCSVWINNAKKHNNWFLVFHFFLLVELWTLSLTMP